MDQTCPVVHKSRHPQARLKTVTLLYIHCVYGGPGHCICLNILGLVLVSINYFLFERKRRRKLRSNFRWSGSKFIILRIPGHDRKLTILRKKVHGADLVVEIWSSWKLWKFISQL
jgi:hypothetical protein